MPGILRRDGPTAVPIRTIKPKVSFAAPLVTGISRPIAYSERWAVWDFEIHAMHCGACYDPYRVHKSGRQLCDRGHKLAQAVAEMLYKTRDGQTYSAIRDSHQDVRVEIPPGFRRTMGLLMAIERALRHRQLFVSLDRTYHIPPRLHHLSQFVEPARVPTQPQRSSRRDLAFYPEIVDWPTPERRLRRPGPVYVPPSPTREGRGYAYDEETIRLRMRQQREQQAAYRLETREPSRHSTHRHRSTTCWD